MKIKNVKLARSIWLLDLQDLNPRGRDIAGQIFDWVRQRYGFVVGPDPRAPLAENSTSPVRSGNQPVSTGAVFENGRFQVRDQVVIEITKLAVYNDGIVVDTSSSTTSCDEFAQDLLTTAASEFSLAYDEETVRKRMYLSELIVHSGISFDAINPRLAAFAQRITAAFPEETKPQFRIAAIQFWSEPNDAGKHRIFTLEQQVGKASTEHRYFSQAPLQTNDHLRLLEELERALIEA